MAYEILVNIILDFIEKSSEITEIFTARNWSKNA